MSIKEAVVWFNQHYDESRKTGDTKNNFYCGITWVLERRANEHNASFICHTKCDTFDTAQELEKQLHAQMVKDIATINKRSKEITTKKPKKTTTKTTKKGE